MSDLSSENAGIQNYVEKLNFRRYLDREIRREGHDYFAPKDGVYVGSPFPSGTQDPITFYHEATRPNGDRAIIVGVEKNDGVHLYRYRGTDNGKYVKDDYVADDYFKDSFDEWYEITENPIPGTTNRLQAVTINGTTVFNNGEDLPYAWRLEWEYIKPIYQLREAGVISAVSMAEYAGMLFLGNVRQALGEIDLFATDPYGDFSEAAAQYHNRLIFSEINDPELWSGSNKGYIIEGKWRVDLVGSPKSYEIGDEITITGAGVNGGNHTARVYDVVPGEFVTQLVPGYRYFIVSDDPTDYALYDGVKYYPGDTFIAKYSTQFLQMVGIPIGSGKKIVYKAAYLLIDEPAATTVEDADVAGVSAATSFSGFDDLADDGASINNMAALQNSLIVYKDKEIVQIEFTANRDNPFNYRLIRTQENNLYFRNTLINLDGEKHFFAGREGFYLFGLADPAPREILNGRFCRNLFFRNAFRNKTKDVYVSQNLLTNEVWVHYKDVSGLRKELCWNYIDDSWSVTDVQASCSGMAFKPGSVEEESIFIIGFDNGVLGVYGLSEKEQVNWGNARQIIYRRSVFDLVNASTATKSGYTSILKSGTGDFGDAYNEKTVRSYVLGAASSQPQNTEVDIKLTMFLNPFDTTGTELMDGGTYTMSNIETNNLVPVYGKGSLLQDTITVTGKDNPLEISARIFDISGIDTNSETRMPA